MSTITVKFKPQTDIFLVKAVSLLEAKAFLMPPLNVVYREYRFKENADTVKCLIAAATILGEQR